MWEKSRSERPIGGGGAPLTYAVLIVHVVNLVNAKSLPLVQLLLLECKPDISDDNPGTRHSSHEGRGGGAGTPRRVHNGGRLQAALCCDA